MNKKTVYVKRLGGCDRCAWHLLKLHNAKDIEVIGHPLKDQTDLKDKVDVTVLIGHATAKDHTVLEELRKKSGSIIAFGTCPYTGGIFGLANQRGGDVVPVGEIIKVDKVFAGCPPSEDALLEFLAKGTEPKTEPLCSTCDRKVQKQYLTEINRVPSLEDKETCFNNQGVPCSGIVSANCTQRCIDFNTPCRGCVPNVADPGPGSLGYFTSLAGQLEVDTRATEWTTDMLGDKPDEITKGLIDVVGTFFRFTLASDFKRRGRKETKKDLFADIVVGRPIEEAPQIVATIYGDYGITAALTLIEAYEKALGLEPNEKTREIRAQLREIQASLLEAQKDPTSDAYNEIINRLKDIAGNEVLSNVYFMGFKTPIKSVKYAFDAYSAQDIEVKAVSSTAEDQFCAVTLETDENGIIREWSIELR